MVAPGQLSLTVGAVQLTTAPQAPGSIASGPMLAGQPAITGGWVSGLTVTVKLQVLCRPAASVAVETIVVVPGGNSVPLAGPLVCTIVAPGQLSVTVGA